MSTINGVYQEICKEGDIACLNRNMGRLLDALEGDINNKIDDQSQGIAYGQKKLEQNIITSTRNKIDETERIIKDNVNAVYSKAADTNNKVDNLENYVTTTQKRQLEDIETSLGQVQLTVEQNNGNISHELDQVNEEIGHAQENIIKDINTELDISSEMLKGEINEHDRAVIERFENISGLISKSGKDLNRSIEDVGDETVKQVKHAAIGIKENTNNVIEGATSQIEHKIVEVEENRNRDNWGIFEGVKQWIEDLFTFDPDAIAKTLVTMSEVGSKVSNIVKTKDQG